MSPHEDISAPSPRAPTLKLRAITDLFTGPTLPKAAMPAPLRWRWLLVAAIAVQMIPGISFAGRLWSLVKRCIDYPLSWLHIPLDLGDGPTVGEAVSEGISIILFAAWIGYWVSVCWRRVEHSEELRSLPELQRIVWWTTLRTMARASFVLLVVFLPFGRFQKSWDWLLHSWENPGLPSRILTFLFGISFRDDPYSKGPLLDTLQDYISGAIGSAPILAAALAGASLGRRNWQSAILGLVGAVGAAIVVVEPMATAIELTYKGSEEMRKVAVAMLSYIPASCGAVAILVAVISSMILRKRLRRILATPAT